MTEAVRDAKIGGRKVKQGQTIVLDPDDGLVAADGDDTKAVLAGLDALKPGFELLTLYYGDGADLDEAEGSLGPPARHRPASRSRSSEAASRTTATSSRPSDESGGRRRPRRTGAATPSAEPTAAADRSGRPPRRASARPACRPRRSSRGPARGSASRPFATSCSTCRSDTTTCASCAASATWSGRGRRHRERQGRRREIRVEQTFRRRVQRTIAVLADETGTWRRPGSAAATSSGACDPACRSSCRAAQAPRSAAHVRQPGVPEGRWHGAAPRRPDRAGLPAHRRADGGAPAGGRPGGARQGRAGLPGIPAAGDPRRRSSCRRSPRPSRRPTSRRRSRHATAPWRASRSTSCWRSRSAWSGGAERAVGPRPSPMPIDRSRGRARPRTALTRRPRATARPSGRPDGGPGDGHGRDPRRPRPADPDAATAPGRRRLGQDRRGGLCARHRRGDRPTGRPARADGSARAAARARRFDALLGDLGIRSTLLTGSLSGRGSAQRRRGHRQRPGARSSSGRTPCSRRASPSPISGSP